MFIAFANWLVSEAPTILKAGACGVAAAGDEGDDILGTEAEAEAEALVFETAFLTDLIMPTP